MASRDFLAAFSQFAVPKKVRWDGAAMKGVIRQWLGTSGAVLGTGGRTRLTLHHTGFDTVPLRDDHGTGWNGAMDRLTAFCGEGQ